MPTSRDMAIFVLMTTTTTTTRTITLPLAHVRGVISSGVSKGWGGSGCSSTPLSSGTTASLIDAPPWPEVQFSRSI